MKPPRYPLGGLRILDLSRVLAGPKATEILGDLGAEVIKIEHPKYGDDTRHWKPPIGPVSKESSYFMCCNRNKKSVAVNLASEQGQEIIQGLAKKSDVLIENFRVGQLKKYGLDYESLRVINPELIYTSISGFGQNGPGKDLPGYDFVVQAMTMMSITGEPDCDPQKVGFALVDVFTGMQAVISILALLQGHERIGQHVDISLYDTALSVLVNQATNYLVGGVNPNRMGNQHPNICPYESLQTQDKQIVVTVGNETQWKSFCTALELSLGPAFDSNEKRIRNRSLLIPLLEETLKQSKADYWIEKLQSFGVPCAPILNMQENLESDLANSRNMILSLNKHERLVNHPIKYSQSPTRTDPGQEWLAPPKLGQHTREILTSFLEYSPETIQEFHQQGIIYCNDTR